MLPTAQFNLKDHKDDDEQKHDEQKPSNSNPSQSSRATGHKDKKKDEKKDDDKKRGDERRRKKKEDNPGPHQQTLQIQMIKSQPTKSLSSNTQPSFTSKPKFLYKPTANSLLKIPITSTQTSLKKNHNPTFI